MDSSAISSAFPQDDVELEDFIDSLRREVLEVESSSGPWELLQLAQRIRDTWLDDVEGTPLPIQVAESVIGTTKRLGKGYIALVLDRVGGEEIPFGNFTCAIPEFVHPQREKAKILRPDVKSPITSPAKSPKSKARKLATNQSGRRVLKFF